MTHGPTHIKLPHYCLFEYFYDRQLETVNFLLLLLLLMMMMMMVVVVVMTRKHADESCSV